MVKSSIKPKHAKDLAKTFPNLRAANLCLNPEKCVFGVPKGKVLVFLVSSKDTEANLDKVQALFNMEEPRLVRDVQKLTCRNVSMVNSCQYQLSAAYPSLGCCEA